MKDFLVLTLILGSVFSGPVAKASSELDSEINAFQVELRPAKTFKKTKAFQKQERLARKQSRPEKQMNFNKKTVAQASQPMDFEPQGFELAEPTPNDASSKTKTRSLKLMGKNGERFIQRLIALPFMAFSVFDGKDDSLMAPKGYSDSFNFGISGQLATDLNLLSSDNFFIETGVAYIQMGSDTGYSFSSGSQSLTLNDHLYTSYLGITLNAKWYSSGERVSSFYVKGGGTPLFLMGTNYSNQGSQFLSASRFGNVSSFDIALDLGIGYSYKVSDDFHVMIDVTAYQGLLPVVSNYSAYNVALTTGIGIGYNL